MNAKMGTGNGNGAVLRGKRIMIVEDEFLIAMDLTDTLEEAGCVVIGLEPSVARALAWLDDHQPDAVLLDLNLNGERSTPVAVRLAERQVPFVLVTGYSRHHSSEPELRAAPRVDKPVNGRRLLSALKEAFSA